MFEEGEARRVPIQQRTGLTADHRTLPWAEKGFLLLLILQKKSRLLLWMELKNLLIKAPNPLVWLRQGEAMIEARAIGSVMSEMERGTGYEVQGTGKTQIRVRERVRVRERDGECISLE